jgi:hypothetical protein
MLSQKHTERSESEAEKYSKAIPLPISDIGRFQSNKCRTFSNPREMRVFKWSHAISCS